MRRTSSPFNGPGTGPLTAQEKIWTEYKRRRKTENTRYTPKGVKSNKVPVMYATADLRRRITHTSGTSFGRIRFRRVKTCLRAHYTLPVG